ncbi:UNVERIFIED_ORG: phage baseplate assembly protein W [Arthrobacter globiformis]|nr:phage baseplate assembly protein W [Arthrobacter globiformis]
MSSTVNAPAPATDVLFGSSFRLENGDLVLASGEASTEPQLVSGLANLKQALTLRLLTPFGTDPVNAGYGLDARRAFTTGQTRRMVKELIRLEVVRTLVSDPRVSEVAEVLFDDDQQFLAQLLAAGEPSPNHRSRLWHVLVTVETVQNVTTSVLVDVEL